MGTACQLCGYDLGGLGWATRCPECGYRTPDRYLTGNLDEAHPAFIRATQRQLRGLMTSDCVVLIGLVCLIAAYARTMASPHHTVASSATLVISVCGGLALAAGVLLGVLFAGYIGHRSRYARPGFDQPRRNTVWTAFWWCVGPLAATVALTIISGGAAACLILVVVPVSIASGGVLYFAMFEHATSVMERCRVDPRWTRTERALSSGSLLAFMLSPFGLIAGVPAIVILLLVAGFLLVTIRLMRLRRAIQVVARVLTLVDQRLAPPGS